MAGIGLLSPAQVNLEVYDNPQVASHYAELNYLTPCERMLMDRYIPWGSSILDLGVGGGRTTRYLSSRARSYVGVDYSAAMIRNCRKKFPQLTFVQADAAKLSTLRDSSFDVICFAFNGLDYLVPEENREACLRECNRLLQPGGTLIFSAHNPRALIVRAGWRERRIHAFARKLVGARSPIYPATVATARACKQVSSGIHAALATLSRVGRRLTQTAFFSGEGFMLDRAHGGLVTHYSTPAKTVSQAAQFGFECMEHAGDDYPRRSSLYSTDWYYYVFTKVTEYNSQALCA